MEKEEFVPPPQQLLSVPKLAIGVCQFPSQPPPYPPPIIEGLVRQSEILLMGGEAKHYKSWARADMCYCIGNGFPWLGFATHPGRIVHFDLELLEADLCWRFNQIHQSYCREGYKGTLENLRYVALRGQSFTVAELERLPEIIQPKDFCMFSLDPVYRLLGGKSESDQAAVTELLLRFLALGYTLKAAIALLQHFAKGDQSQKQAQDRFSGSGVWSRFPDSLMTFTDLEDENTFSVEFILRSFKPVEKFAVRWEFPRFRVDQALDPENLRTKPASGRPPKYEHQMLAAILGDQNLAHNQFFRRAKEATGISKRTFERCLEAAVAQGVIHNSKLGYGVTPKYLENMLNNGQ